MGLQFRLKGSEPYQWVHIRLIFHKAIVKKKMEATIVYWGYIGIIENKMEATRIYWGYAPFGSFMDGYGRNRTREKCRRVPCTVGPSPSNLNLKPEIAVSMYFSSIPI